jgi:hypothetical protein
VVKYGYAGCRYAPRAVRTEGPAVMDRVRGMRGSGG